jgi:hypothetical protein
MVNLTCVGRWARGALPLIATCWLLPGAAGAEPPAGQPAGWSLEEVRAAVRPGPGEAPWADLPWLTSLHDARRKAAAEGKLILLWKAGGGQPLGFV